MPAELHDFLEARPRRLETAPGAERLAFVGVADRVAPVELAQVAVVEGAAAETDHARFQRLDRRHHVRPPAIDRLLRHERGVIEPERAGTAELDRQRRVRIGAVYREITAVLDPFLCRCEFGGSVNLVIAAKSYGDRTGNALLPEETRKDTCLARLDRDAVLGNADRTRRLGRERRSSWQTSPLTGFSLSSEISAPIGRADRVPRVFAEVGFLEEDDFIGRRPFEAAIV